MDDCSVLAESKVATRPLLYLPADFPKPAQLDGIAARCHVDVKVLPEVTQRLGELQATQLPKQGLLYLPNPYVVPSGFFNEMYGRDSYFIVLGLIADHRASLARTDAVEAAALKQSSRDVQASTVCASGWSKGYRLRADFYLGDRAIRKSGFDITFRMGPFGGSAHHYAPVDLNSLPYRYESDLHDFVARLASTSRHSTGPLRLRPGARRSTCTCGDRIAACTWITISSRTSPPTTTS